MRTPRRMLLAAVAALVSMFAAAGAARAESPEQRTARHLASIHQDPSLLLSFVRAMPKGGDLHMHLGGAVYAESWIDWAAREGLCVERKSANLSAAPCDAACDRAADKPAVHCAYQDPLLYNQLIDAWSMRNFDRAQLGHDHFFAAFEKFSLIAFRSAGDELAEVASRAAADKVRYLEIMHSADARQASELGARLGWDDDFGRMRDALLAGGMKDVLTATRQQLDRDEARRRELLHCDTPQADGGCQVTVRYLYQVLRGLPRPMVFAQMLLGFELAKADARFVGLNLVMPEDWYVPMHDFDLHMKMLDFLHGLYPTVHISLHAGELAPGLVPPEGLRNHIRASIEHGHAERIGHGVSVMSEEDAPGLLAEMASRHVLVEICLTSNDVILGIQGADHPLPTYIRHGVPVALATDDEGVSRSDMTHEYLRAVQTYDLPYSQLKRMARQSLEYSFLAGPSLWTEVRDSRPVAACAADRPGGAPTPSCRAFLDASDRATAQWELEGAFARFEKAY